MVTSTVPRPPDDHKCGWKRWAAELESKLLVVMGEMDALKRQVFGKKSEKMPPMDREVRKQRPADPEATQARRRKNAELRAIRVETEDVHLQVPEADRRRPKCERTDLKKVCDGKEFFA